MTQVKIFLSRPLTNRKGWWLFLLPFLWSYVAFTIVASYCDIVVISKYYTWHSTEAMLRVAGSLLIAQDTLCLMGVFPMAILWLWPLIIRAQNA